MPLFISTTQWIVSRGQCFQFDIYIFLTTTITWYANKNKNKGLRYKLRINNISFKSILYSKKKRQQKETTTLRILLSFIFLHIKQHTETQFVHIRVKIGLITSGTHNLNI